MSRKDFSMDHPRGSVFKNDLSDKFLLLKSPSRNSSDLQVFRVFPLAKNIFSDVLFWIILVDRDSRTTYQTSFPC